MTSSEAFVYEVGKRKQGGFRLLVLIGKYTRLYIVKNIFNVSLLLFHSNCGIILLNQEVVRGGFNGNYNI